MKCFSFNLQPTFKDPKINYKNEDLEILFCVGIKLMASHHLNTKLRNYIFVYFKVFIILE